MIVSVYFAIVLGMFVVTWLFKRRSGLLGLALAAGYCLNITVISQLSSILGDFSIFGLSGSMLLFTIGQLLPLVLVFFFTSKYSSHLLRLVGSFVVAIMTAAFLGQIFAGSVDQMFSFEKDIFGFIQYYSQYIIAGGLVLSVVDIIFASISHKSDSKHHKRR